MVTIYDSSPNRVVEAIELVDNELWQQSVKLKSGLNNKWRLDNSHQVFNLHTPTANLVQHLKTYANDYHLAKSMAQFSDASELHEPYIKLLEEWVECTAHHYELTQEVLKAKVNIMLGRIAHQDKKIHRTRIGLGALSVACTVWMGFNIHAYIGVGKQRSIVEQKLGQVNTTYNQVYSETLKTFPAKKSRGLWGFAKHIVGYTDPPPDSLSKVEIPQNPTLEQQDLLDKLKLVGEQRKIVLNEFNRLDNKQKRSTIAIVFSGLTLIFVPLYGWIWIPANRKMAYRRL
ncbi:hypothetical protein NIES4071_15630 [Calothrix sp. NIES-4071]|nr:hypothetical protein NIES4071_15630 [Calothrix sp. NIES-4071]BAZ55900.1 hypothetical protein NIES4105_15580 [Calothrix sp. NIES-4105]